MKTINNILVRLLLTLISLLAFLVPITAEANVAASPNYPGDAADVSVTYKYNGNSISGEEIKIYKVAGENKGGTLTPVVPFSGLSLKQIDMDSYRFITDTEKEIETVINRKEPAPKIIGKTDENGSFTVNGLAKGLYFIPAVSVKSKGNYLSFNPVLFLSSGNDINIVPKGEDTTQRYSLYKVWKDEGNKEKRPESVDIEIFKDGKTYKTVTLSSKNQWEYKWTGSYDSSFTVKEKSVPYGYLSKVSDKGNTFTVTNTYTGDKGTNPQTGAEPVAGTVIILAAVSLLSAMIFLKKEKRND